MSDTGGSSQVVRDAVRHSSGLGSDVWASLGGSSREVLSVGDDREEDPIETGTAERVNPESWVSQLTCESVVAGAVGVAWVCVCVWLLVREAKEEEPGGGDGFGAGELLGVGPSGEFIEGF